MILPIIKHPEPSILQQPCSVVSLDMIKKEETKELMLSMIDTMHHAEGVGIAAPQVGTTNQLCIIGKSSFPMHISVLKGNISHNRDLLLINPTWTKRSRKTAWDTEGCLSIPKVYGKVKRYTDITVQALDIHGNELLFVASQFFARVIQHEVDHLQGVLFIEKAKDLYEVD